MNMAISYLWNVTSMSTIEASPTETHFVVTANYEVIGTEDVNGTIYTSSINNTAFFELDPNKPDYIPYADLTNDIVVGWIKEQLGVDAVANYEESIAGQIELQINPPVTPQPTPLPW